MLNTTEQSATINWTSPSSSSSATHAHSNHGSTGDTVKVEVWDVVDKAIRTARNSANRFSTADLVYTLKGDGKSKNESGCGSFSTCRTFSGKSPITYALEHSVLEFCEKLRLSVRSFACVFLHLSC
jgi:hypothetical protein